MNGNPFNEGESTWEKKQFFDQRIRCKGNRMLGDAQRSVWRGENTIICMAERITKRH